METNFTFLRMVVFAGLVAGFLKVAFAMCPHLQDMPSLGQRSTDRACGYIVFLFVGSAFAACFSDFTYGLFPPKSLRSWIIRGSALLMTFAFFLLWSLHRGMSVE